jgi:hypothetical protein
LLGGVLRGWRRGQWGSAAATDAREHGEGQDAWRGGNRRLPATAAYGCCGDEGSARLPGGWKAAFAPVPETVITAVASRGVENEEKAGAEEEGRGVCCLAAAAPMPRMVTD